MKFLKNLILTAVIALCAANASAQFNLFSEPRTLIVTPPQFVTTTVSNTIVDIHGWEGVAKLDLISQTNVTTNGITALITTSPDRTNWTAIANYALGVSNAVILTNTFYGTATPLATNLYQSGGVKTIPTAATAGFTTTYTTALPFTNSGSITVAGFGAVDSSGVQTVGFVIPDQARYLQIVWTTTGTSTNPICAILTGRKQQE